MDKFEIEKTKYIQKIKNPDKAILKNVILIICVVGILTIIIGVVACLRNRRYLDLIYYLMAFILVLVIQFATVFLCYELIIEFNEGILKVVKSYGGINKTVFECECRQMSVEKFSAEIDYGKIIALSPKGCAESRYVLKLSGRKYLLNLDDYMYSLIEVASDLS